MSKKTPRKVYRERYAELKKIGVDVRGLSRAKTPSEKGRITRLYNKLQDVRENPSHYQGIKVKDAKKTELPGPRSGNTIFVPKSPNTKVTYKNGNLTYTRRIKDRHTGKTIVIRTTVVVDAGPSGGKPDVSKLKDRVKASRKLQKLASLYEQQEMRARRQKGKYTVGMVLDKKGTTFRLPVGSPDESLAEGILSNIEAWIERNYSEWFFDHFAVVEQYETFEDLDDDENLDDDEK